METKTKQLETCRTCPGQNCQECADNEFVKTIQTSLSGVHNLFLPADVASYFGRLPCDTCKDKLAGDRYKICGIGNHTGGTVEFIVCVDCFGYLFT